MYLLLIKNDHFFYNSFRYNKREIDLGRYLEMSLTQRSIRITASAVLSVIVALFIGLENPLAAGIIAILGVLETHLETIENAFTMLMSNILAFIVATIIFLILGFSVLSFGIYLAIYVPLAYILKVDSAIAPCSVLVIHFIIAESIAWQWQLNGMLIMVIGLVFALLANAWYPSYHQKLETYIGDIERQMSLILFLLEKRLSSGGETTERIQAELKELNEEITTFENLALIENENRQFTQAEQGYYIRYAQMPKQQYDILSIITDSLSNILENTEENEILASIFGETAEQLDESNTGVELLKYISDLYRVFRDSELPRTRKEFESRAILYNILTDFEKFLELKRDFYLDYGEEKAVK